MSGGVVRRQLTAALLATTCLVLAACAGPDTGSGSSSTQGSDGTKDSNVTLGVAMIDLTAPFFVRMQQAGTKAAGDYGVEAVWQSAEGNLEKQIGIVENFIRQKVDVILINAVDDKGILPAIRKAQDAGIPVVMMANDIKDPYVYRTLYPDYDNMAMQARVLGTTLGGKGKVALLIGTRGNSVSDSREAGFVDAMKKEFPGIQVVAIQPSDWDPAKGRSIGETLLTQHPDLAAISSVTDPVLLAAMSAARSAGKTDVKWVGYDGDAEMHPMLNDGSMLVDVLTGAERVGYWNIAVGTRVARGEKLPKALYLPTFFVTSEKTAADLAAKGLKIESITPEKAIEAAQDYAEQFGPDVPPEKLNQGTKGRVS
jgi:ribose transport system substrate-binding protein